MVQLWINSRDQNCTAIISCHAENTAFSVHATGIEKYWSECIVFSKCAYCSNSECGSRLRPKFRSRKQMKTLYSGSIRGRGVDTIQFLSFILECHAQDLCLDLWNCTSCPICKKRFEQYWNWICSDCGLLSYYTLVKTDAPSKSGHIKYMKHEEGCILLQEE